MIRFDVENNVPVLAKSVCDLRPLLRTRIFGTFSLVLLDFFSNFQRKIEKSLKVVPPSILEADTSTDTVVEERAKVSLRCSASGYPPPQVSWRREKSKDINLGSVGNTKNIVQRVEGEYLNLTQVTREDMGAYLCIAKNGVPPSVSKRILLQVNFSPKIKVANQMVYAVGGSEAVLGCNLEASPRPLTSWIRHDDVVLINNHKFEIIEKEEDSYKIIMQLKIRNVSDNDFGHYKCLAKNTFGDKEGFVRLIEQITTTTTAMSTIPYRVFIPIQRVVTESHTSEGTTIDKKEYGAPTTNSLRDESQVVSSEKQLGPGKVESRLEDETQQRRTVDQRPKNAKKSTSGSNKSFSVPCLLLYAAASFNLISNYLLRA
ncbi:lachesin [Trichonephila clavipes]|nr:lachesin [Trichonephila clavipes]